jgi:hypothetical protein
MAAKKIYLALGIEAARGTAESTTVGFLPLSSTKLPDFQPDDQRKNDFRGEESSLGDIGWRRMSTKWVYSLETPFYSESGGGIKSGPCALLKHFFGFCGSSLNAATGQYLHMMYPVADPLLTDTGFLGATALTVNFNQSEGETVKNHAWEGGLVSGIVLTSEPGQLLKLTANLMGQKKVVSGTAIATPTFAAENLSCWYKHLKVYTGTITRTGTAPNFTQFAFTSATRLYPGKVVLTLENGKTDTLIHAGVDYPTKQNIGKFKATLAMDFDFSDPASGFNTVDEVNAFLAGIATTNFFLHWDTGTQAGTGDNHGLLIDLPVMTNKGGVPEFSADSDPKVTLTYEADMDAATTEYLVGCMVKNTADEI